MTSPTGASDVDPQQPHQPQIVADARAGHAAALVENPPRQAVVDPQASSARSTARSTNGNSAAAGPDKARGAADRFRKVQHRVIARQHQMIAVVDRHADGAVEIRPAAAARIGGGLVHDDLGLRRRQLDRRCKAREACADNVDCARHQMIAYCTAIQDSRSRLTLTRVRGGAQPRAIMPCSMTR